MIQAILLDNGHGINTPGKRSPIWSDGSQLFEFEFNRDIVHRIHDGLKACDITSIILVPEIEDISLEDRVKRTLNYPNDSLLVSVHANAGGGTGWEIYTSKGQTKSDVYATEFYKEAALYLKDYRMRTDTSDGDPDKEEDFYLLRKTRCSAVLTENLFMDTEKDCRFLMSEMGRDTIAKIHIHALLNIIKMK